MRSIAYSIDTSPRLIFSNKIIWFLRMVFFFLTKMCLSASRFRR